VLISLAALGSEVAAAPLNNSRHGKSDADLAEIDLGSIRLSLLFARCSLLNYFAQSG
jgi:hypothetical protein